MNARTLAYHALLLIQERQIHPDSLLRSMFRRFNTMDKREKALATELVYGVLRWQGRLDWYIETLSKTPLRKIAPHVMVLLRLGLYQITFLTKIPAHAAVNETVKIARATQPKHIVSFVNGILRNAARRHPDWPFPDRKSDPLTYLAVLTSHPRWFVEKMMHHFSMEEVQKICEANNEVPGLNIRVNLLRAQPEMVAQWFRKRGAIVEQGRYLSTAMTIRNPSEDIGQTEPFIQGWIQIQDEASQLIPLMVNPLPGERLLDLCTGYGIKATQLAEIMKNKGQILAVDSASWKLEALMENVKRLGIEIISTRTEDVRSLNPEEVGLFDRVLLDAPCTGWGTIRRNPDIKWKTHPRDPWRAGKQQYDLLDHAANFVKPGGTLTYATCTIFSEENEDVAQRFEEKWKWPRINPSDVIPHSEKLLEKYNLRTWPHRHGIDGFFGVTWAKPK
ncbi:MAG TPA: 16S rRNA (cytosine(967)-C(5))-methyltransferase RsmB [Thermodesulforhabdus norvegica]|uniref:16S rRNA (cytosine(967)-C(5))-methyltransferase n=1 Tax=Thermodesulforhabdus norvegica TaxID=39841 RepID=A0A7C1AWP5_9BACT|nr:16S rRNA (cytosine(967)-C(5))-methyltransferase RsmB [Thermodesulforhabdus norvegica]